MSEKKQLGIVTSAEIIDKPNVEIDSKTLEKKLEWFRQGHEEGYQMRGIVR